MLKTSKSDLPKEFRAQIEAERDRLGDEASVAQAEMDRIAGRQTAIATLLSAYDTTPVVVQTKVLLLAPPEKMKKRAKSSRPRASKADRPGKSNLEMMIVALQTTRAPMSGVELRTWVRENLWAGCPDGFASAPFGYIEDGRLVKDGSKFKLPEARGERLPEKLAPRRDATVAATAPPRPPTKPTPPAPAVDSPTTRRTFLHKGNGALLSLKHWRLVDRLHKTMGKGYLPHKACVTAALNTDYSGSSAEDWLRTELPVINSAVATIGLTMVVEKAGVFLREAS